tara:strand:- start:368 stop:667 length:300 start_codon:yes stop_codon:yes gene_type:complete
MADEDKKFRHPAGVSIRKGLDRQRYLRSDQGKAEKKARKEHNKKFSSTVDKKTKRAIKKAAKKSDAAKGATMRKRDAYEYAEEFRNGGKVSLGEFKGNF